MPEDSEQAVKPTRAGGKLDYVTIVLVGVIVVLAVIGAAWLHFGPQLSGAANCIAIAATSPRNTAASTAVMSQPASSADMSNMQLGLAQIQDIR